MADLQLLERVGKELARGAPHDEIVAALEKEGWSAGDVRGAIAIRSLEQIGKQQGNRKLISELSPLVAPRQRYASDGVPAGPFLVLVAILLVVAGGALYLYEPSSLDFITRGRTAAAVPTEFGGTMLAETSRTYTHTYTFTEEPKSAAPKPASSGGSSFVPPLTTYVPPSPAPSVLSAIEPVEETGTAEGAVTAPTARPTVRLTLAETSIAPNTSTTLTWSAKNATSCSSTGFDIAGQQTGKVTVTTSDRTRFTLTCTGPGGERTTSAFLSVNIIVPPPPEQVAAAPTPTPDPVPVAIPEPEVTPPATPSGPPQEIPEIAQNPDGYPVYPGCEQPATTYARELYIDPVGGNDSGDGSRTAPYRSFSAVIAAKKIQPGDHVVLLAGNHGPISLKGAGLPAFASATSWTWLDFQSGATGYSVSAEGISRLLVTGGEFVKDPAATSVGGLRFWITRSSHIVVADTRQYHAKDSAGWDVPKWMSLSSGMQANNSTCTSFVNNRIKNVRGGIGVIKGGNTPAENSAKALVKGNEIRNFSADGMVMNGSDITVRDNRLYDQYAGMEDGDPNHDDGLQMFAGVNQVFDNVRIEDNWFQERTSLNRELDAHMQGIVVFDGKVTNMRVTGNVVLGSAYHGIALYGAQNSLVDHNTVQNPTTNGHAYWISVPKAKAAFGAFPPTGTKVSNNIAHAYIIAEGATASN
ncbi:MAG TPA: right-handed parallel beta-helix repeat-containing protein, partial [Candidatus Paceibacterota bacterium]|nr:right-handed parallel beta-helix repeat-containing protein [Candidatus Paceibacterota bacterium]